MNNPTPHTCLIGLGSPHGDDQFGWAVVDRLATMELSHVTLTKSEHPVDILGVLDANERVIVVDAAEGLPPDEPIRKLQIANEIDIRFFHETPHRGTHDMGLESVFRLARSLKKPTDHVTLWVGNGEQFEPFSLMSATTQSNSVRCAELIASEVSDA
ncbi:hypothetical protein [Rhodopirellula sp. SWK7]|uniref:hypothetical protein n=1 Tax=Rhodopirellula sp. SWK7 TaxID=595460 RepID=UPI0002BE95B1|nr:hypothetical protein [Rhodopirellula sp. SWK7]EMI47000.1 hypothetical protein RRSWK_00656 [Rhodopirellula sp. SWK7]